MKALAPLILASLALTASAAKADGFLQITGPLQILGDCNAPGTEVRVVPTQDGDVFDVAVPSMDLEADSSAPRVHKYCNIRAQVSVPPGYRVAPRTLTYQGLSDISEEGGSANISARYYLSGTLGVNGFRAFGPGEKGNFDVATTAGSLQYTACGGTAEFNFLADMTARIRPGAGPDTFSQLTLDRGVADVDVPPTTPVFQCGVQVVPCY